MRHIYGLVIAAGLLLGQASIANAQFSFAIGNPYTGAGFSLSIPGIGGYYGGYGGYGYGLGYPSAYGLYGEGIGLPGFGTTYYNSAYSGYLAPGTSYFATGNYGLYPGIGGYGYPGYGTGFGGIGSYYGGIAPYYGSGLGNYGYASTGMFMGLPRPFGGLIRVPR